MIDETETIEIQSNDNLLPSELSQQEIINKISSAKNSDELKELTTIFNMNLVKKDMARATAESDLLDSILKEVTTRITTRPGELSNKDLLDYMTAIKNNIVSTQKMIQGVNDNPLLIKINQSNQSINLNIDSDSLQLSRESREKVANTIKNILNNLSADDKDIITIDTTNGEEHDD